MPQIGFNAAEKAAHGAAMFDIVFGPNWTDYIDTNDLNIACSCECTIAQVTSKHPTFAKAVEAHLTSMHADCPGEQSPYISGWEICFPNIGHPEIVAMGCDIDMAVKHLEDGKKVEIYEALTDAWLVEIARRRNTRQKSEVSSVEKVLEDA